MTSDHVPPARCETITLAGETAPWIVMLHGVSQDRRIFDKQVEEFSVDFRLLLIDLPGHGLSSDLPGPYGLEAFAESIHGTLKEAGLEHSHFWGTHLGAGVGLLLACRMPQFFRSLILEGPVFPGRSLPAVTNFLREVSETTRTDGIQAARDLWWNEGNWFAIIRARPDRCRAAEHRTIINDFLGQPWLDSGLANRPISPIDDQLSALDVPVLIMNGEHDLPDFHAATEQLATVLANCRCTVVKDAGGFPLWEYPERINDQVRLFLKHL
ncbi:alpha/beta fold hydrolase [Pelagibius sp. Alg239-R121]|uniref:alpha/beta fold hydrolase n=1 Tax=Pelagibius sp. Alg239-R121 TaxID=2993448 RepID=UPI0024A6B9EC|nr:alpha/beta hydrolase [Pelagibius sp. Alg239-R121]